LLSYDKKLEYHTAPFDPEEKDEEENQGHEAFVSDMTSYEIASSILNNAVMDEIDGLFWFTKA
jgi:hypothetical protein